MADVLVVDDTEAALDLLGYLLRVRGHLVKLARNGEEAVAAALGSPPDLILMDLHMPVMDGYEALAAIRDSDEAGACPILALTAFGEVDEREKAVAAGFDGFFSTPITPETFMDQLEAFLDGEDRRAPTGASSARPAAG
ncbi:MAG: response regulator [Actinomycetota bacterium]